MNKQPVGVTTITMDEELATTITAVIHRDHGEGLGIAVGEKNGRAVITHITEGGPVSETALQVGMVILSVNHESCTCLQIQDIRRLLRLRDTTGQGSLTIVAKSLPELGSGSLIAAVVTKMDPREPVGIELDIANGDVIITEIMWDSLAYHTDLQAGMKVKSINNVECHGKTIPQIRNLLASAIPTVSILAQVRDEKAEYPVLYATAPTPTGRTRGAVAPVTEMMMKEYSGEQQGRPPPPGLPGGGYWTIKNYAGVTTLVAFVVGCFCFGVLAPVALCCPCDERMEYVVDGGVYNTEVSLTS